VIYSTCLLAKSETIYSELLNIDIYFTAFCPIITVKDKVYIYSFHTLSFKIQIVLL